MGDRAAFAEVYDATASGAFGLALRVVRDRSHAEDVIQEAYLHIWRKGANFDPQRGTAMGWIFMVVHGKAVDRVRSAQSRSNRDEVYFRESRYAEQTSPQDPTGDLVLATSEGRRVRFALSQLTAVQRQSVELAYFGGYTCTEIARMTGVPLGTAKSRMRDGLLKLRDLMGAPPHP
jgi:RNA polymerase sigma-70 factor (ECF subfamily)